MLSETQNAYKVDLEVFEGPLDLLLHLIKKNDVDIIDIPISLILEQYMEYLNLLEELNIDLAGDFLLMASELAHIKSKLLLPDHDKGEEDEEGEDPRAELIRRLLEYQRYKEAANALAARPMLGRDVFAHGMTPDPIEEEEAPVEVDLFQLISCFYEMLKKAPKTTVHEVRVERVSVTERIYELMDKMRGQSMLEFRQLFDGQATRGGLIVTFLAVLEMVRMKVLQVTQSQTYGEIYLVPAFEGADLQNLEANVTIQ
ncbi:segregation/condensation protein A [Deltaproteobacteria bacterium PRO3]|nr:segregation/condensation protein A [Deltaproteobacteria bacterium PRO3]